MLAEHERLEAVRSAAAGNADALQQLIVLYHPALRAVVAGRVPGDLAHRIDPDDVLQQAYIAAFRGLQPGSGGMHGPVFDGPGGFFRWLEAIALARLADAERAWRREKRAVGREALPPAATGTTTFPAFVERLVGTDTSASGRVAREEAVAAVLASLARLTDEQREVVRLRFLEGLPVAEVAARLGKSEAAIHMLCHRGLKGLREMMGKGRRE
ncbi:MAG: sigma-70 family RNA polymerase sigma factor [Planctomycetota bacterium]